MRATATPVDSLAAPDTASVRAGDRTAALSAALVWLVTLALAAFVLANIAQHTYNIPLAEDWHLVPPLTGNEPRLWDWLWAQNNEHRTPLPRLVQLSILRATHDFRAGMVVNVLLATAVVVLLVGTLRALRGGRIRAIDAFVPIAFLHLGHWENLGWSWQICFVLSTALTCALLAALARGPIWESPARAAAAAGSIAALPLCGATGMVVAWVAAGYLSIEAARRLRKPGADRRPAWIVLGGAALMAVETAYYFTDYYPADWNPPSPGPLHTIKTTMKLLALGLGPAARESWPVSSLIVVAVLSASALLVLRAAWRGRAAERDRAAGMLALGCGLAALAFAMGWGRAGLVSSVGLPARYAFLTAPALVWAYFAAELYATVPARRAIQGTLLAASLLAFPLNVQFGHFSRDWFAMGMERVKVDIEAGVPHETLVERHQPFLMHWDRERLSEGIGMLHEKGVGDFADMRLR